MACKKVRLNKQRKYLVWIRERGKCQIIDDDKGVPFNFYLFYGIGGMENG